MKASATPNRARVFGIGLQKTGTTTLGDALQILGYKHQSFSDRGVRMYLNGSVQELLQWSQQFHSCEDEPWLFLYREFDQQYPGSKFILTRRHSASAWFDSLVKHYRDRMGAYVPIRDMNIRQYGRPDPESDRTAAIAVYEQHLQTVRDYFSGREQDFIEVCWEEGDGWERLCAFLGQAVPSTDFPHSNKAPSLWELWKRRRERRRAAKQRQIAALGGPS